MPRTPRHDSRGRFSASGLLARAPRSQFVTTPTGCGDAVWFPHLRFRRGPPGLVPYPGKRSTSSPLVKSPSGWLVVHGSIAVVVWIRFCLVWTPCLCSPLSVCLRPSPPSSPPPVPHVHVTCICRVARAPLSSSPCPLPIRVARSRPRGQTPLPYCSSSLARPSRPHSHSPSCIFPSGGIAHP